MPDSFGDFANFGSIERKAESVVAPPLSLPDVSTFTATLDGPYFASPSGQIPDGATAVTIHMGFTLAADAGPTMQLFKFAGAGGNAFTVRRNNSNRLYVTVTDSAGNKALNNASTAKNKILNGVAYEWAISADFSTGTAKLWRKQSGAWANQKTMTMATNTGAFAADQTLHVMNNNSPTTDFQLRGDVDFIDVYYSAAANGDVPVSDPARRITGPALTANSDAWKLGSDAA